MYERKTAQNKASVIRRLVNLKYKYGQSVTEHLSVFQGLINLLTNMKMLKIAYEEARRKEQGVVAKSEALVSEYRGRTNNKKFHRRDKSKGRSRDGSRGRSKTRNDLEFYHCGGIGHMKRECRLFKREQDRVDFGASFNVTSWRDFFTSYTNGDFGNVRMGNDKLSKIVGSGDISLETDTSCHLILKDVTHVPDMRLNLISTVLLDDEGYSNVFAEGK
ncbi:hypothetical protein L3X38_041913 [Prunus dulcis]|uniref:CCHC-type domain-containing protein n=1 Tax=Prunus dulcis TaxID=3755 RepID=A0AAD4UVB0_PRUDU|nr:hypothetical protein L3X38_041913 [Prunus dulcis]